MALTRLARDDRGMSMLRSLAVAAALILPMPLQNLSAQAVLTPEILNQLHRVGGLTLAPDGKHLLFTVSTPDSQANKGTTRVYLLSLEEAGLDLGEARQ